MLLASDLPIIIHHCQPGVTACGMLPQPACEAAPYVLLVDCGGSSGRLQHAARW